MDGGISTVQQMTGAGGRTAPQLHADGFRASAIRVTRGGSPIGQCPVSAQNGATTTSDAGNARFSAAPVLSFFATGVHRHPANARNLRLVGQAPSTSRLYSSLLPPAPDGQTPTAQQRSTHRYPDESSMVAEVTGRMGRAKLAAGGSIESLPAEQADARPAPASSQQTDAGQLAYRGNRRIGGGAATTPTSAPNAMRGGYRR